MQESGFFKLGLFVIAGVALIVAAVIVLGAGALNKDMFVIETALDESAQGLDIGAQVKYMGIPVGKVRNIQMGSIAYPSDDLAMRQERAKLVVIDILFDHSVLAKDGRSLKERVADAVKGGMRIRKAQAGLTGPGYLQMDFLDPKLYPEPKIPFEPRELYVPSAPSFGETVTSAVEKLAEELRGMKLKEMSDNVNGLLVEVRTSVKDLQIKTLSEKAIGTLDDADASMRRVKDILHGPEVDTMVKDASQSMAGIKGIVQGEEVKSLMARLPQVASNLESASKELSRLLKDPKVQKMMDNLASTAGNADKASVDLRRSLHDLSAILGSGRQNLEEFFVGMRRTADNAAVLTGNLKQNPSQVIFGEPPPRLNEGQSK